MGSSAPALPAGRPPRENCISYPTTLYYITYLLLTPSFESFVSQSSRLCARLAGWQVFARKPLVIHNRPQPLFHLHKIFPLPLRQVLNLIFTNFAYTKILRIRMRKIPSAHTRCRIHGHAFC